jgi:hypothetical protein
MFIRLSNSWYSLGKGSTDGVSSVVVIGIDHFILKKKG